MLLKDEEIAKLRLKSTYEDDDWVIPPFVLRAKEVSLPKVNGRQMMEREKDEREMEINDDIYGGGSKSTGDSDSENGDVVKQQHHSAHNSYKRQQSKTVNEGFAPKRET